ncbi:MAG: hypothetical protein KAS32_06140, partial [Candidatus Peribacteraceae bacterium]|nr:hypothetical protein [Candidatus Peribacteraceae bacterium]
MSNWGIETYNSYSDLWVSTIHGGPQIQTLNGDMVWDGGYSSEFSLISQKDFKGMYVKLLVDGHRKLNYWTSHNNQFMQYLGSFTVDIGGLTYTLGGDSEVYNIWQPNLLENYGLTMIEINPSILDPNYLEMWINGQYHSSTTLSDTAKALVKITGSSYIEVKEVKYKVPFESCSQRGNRILITESFAGPQTFNEFKLSYSPAQYCLDHPVIITDAIKKGSAATSEPYAILSKGETFTIPS